MPDFSHSLNVRTRAIAPEYTSQWADRIVTFQRIPDGIDWLEVGYPYSSSNNRIIDGAAMINGEVNDCALLTIAGVPMLTITGEYLRRI